MASTIIINLDERSDRLTYQQQQAARCGLSFVRLAAIKGDDVSDAQYERLAHGWQRPASRNEVACYLSHEHAWRLAAARVAPTLILEDDAVYDHSLVELLAALPTTDEPIHWNLEAGLKRKLLAPACAGELGRFRSYTIHLDRGGAAGYVLTPAAARLLLREPRARPIAPPDHYLHGFPGIRHLQVEPAPVTQLHHHAKRLGQKEEEAAVSALTPSRESIRKRKELLTSRGLQFRARRLWGEASTLAVRLSLLGRSTRRLVKSFDEPQPPKRAA